MLYYNHSVTELLVEVYIRFQTFTGHQLDHKKLGKLYNGGHKRKSCAVLGECGSQTWPADFGGQPEHGTSQGPPLHAPIAPQGQHSGSYRMLCLHYTKYKIQGTRCGVQISDLK